MGLQTLGSILFFALIILLILAPLRGMGLLRDHYLPELIMDILDTMTNRALLERLLDERGHDGTPVFVDAKKLAREINRRVIGQADVIGELSDLIASRLAKTRRRRPVAVILISGPPGTGKTELGKAIGDALPGYSGHYLVEMNKLKDATALNSLFGAAPGYVGSDRKASLMTHLLDFPRSVIILDEFEKACPDAQNAFLAAWQEGYLRESTRYGKISTKDAIFVLTANARQEEIRDLVERQRDLQERAPANAMTGEELSESCREILKRDLPGPVLSRIDRVFAFAALTPMALAAIALKIIVDEIEDYGLNLKAVPPQVILPYVNRYNGNTFDARDLYRHIERDFGGAASTLKQQGAKIVEIAFDVKSQSMILREVIEKSSARQKASHPA